MLAQTQEATEAFTKILSENGIIAACFVAILAAVFYAGWKWGGLMVTSMTENNRRVALATEKMADASSKLADANVLISGSLSGVERDVASLKEGQNNIREAMKLALDAMKTEDVHVRHNLIDQANRKLG